MFKFFLKNIVKSNDFKSKEKIKKIFDTVSGEYDIMNDLMSFGLQRIWKKKFVSNLMIDKNHKLIDLASGTCDIPFYVKSKYQDLKITASDINEKMLQKGKEKMINNGILDIDYKIIDAEKMILKKGEFDICTIAFGIRNIQNPKAALKEVRRILNKNGIFYCLEFNNTENKFFNNIYKLYNNTILPNLGKIVVNDKSPYEYLAKSIDDFISAEDFSNLLYESGFKYVNMEKIHNGVLCIHKAWG